VGLEEELVFGDEVAVRGHGAFGQAGRAAGVVQLGDCVLACGLVVEAQPGALAVGEERAPGGVAGGHGLGGEGVEDEEVCADVDVVLAKGGLHVLEDFGLGEDEFGLGDADGVGEFGGGVRGVCRDGAGA